MQFNQEKTDGAETMPISDQAYVMLGERGGADEYVFKGLRYCRLKPFIKKWVFNLGIQTSNFTFHCARYTFATLQLSVGTDLFTLMKLMGYRSIKSTQRYLHLIDKVRKEAVNRIVLNPIAEVKVLPKEFPGIWFHSGSVK